MTASCSRYLLSTYRSEDCVVIQCEDVPQAEEALSEVMAWLLSQDDRCHNEVRKCLTRARVHQNCPSCACEEPDACKEPDA